MSKNKYYPENRSLTKSEVRKFIEDGSKLHREFTDEMYEKYDTGQEKKDLVYELANGDFMYVFDPNWFSTPGKGRYWERDSFLRFIRRSKNVEEDYKHGRASSVDHWRFYSKQRNDLLKNQDLNLDTISKELQIDKAKLDFSYKSLGLIDEAVEKYGTAKAVETLYDALVFYVGQLIADRTGGQWKIDSRTKQAYPFIGVENSRLHYMPVNIVWEELGGSHPCDLRKATADEIRTNAWLHPKNDK